MSSTESRQAQPDRRALYELEQEMKAAAGDAFGFALVIPKESVQTAALVGLTGNHLAALAASSGIEAAGVPAPSGAVVDVSQNMDASLTVRVHAFTDLEPVDDGTRHQLADLLAALNEQAPATIGDAE